MSQQCLHFFLNVFHFYKLIWIMLFTLKKKCIHFCIMILTWSHYVYYPYLPFARFLWFFTLKMINMFSKIFHIFKVCPNNVYISFKMCTTFTNSIWIFLIINPRLYNVQFRGTLNIIATLLFKKFFSLSDYKYILCLQITLYTRAY